MDGEIHGSCVWRVERCGIFKEFCWLRQIKETGQTQVWPMAEICVWKQGPGDLQKRTDPASGELSGKIWASGSALFKHSCLLFSLFHCCCWMQLAIVHVNESLTSSLQFKHLGLCQSPRRHGDDSTPPPCCQHPGVKGYWLCVRNCQAAICHYF